MAKRKIPQTLDFVEGLLTLAEKADEMIGSPDTHPRYITTKLKPRWDVHLAGSFAGKLQPWIAGLSGSAVSPRLCGG